MGCRTQSAGGTPKSTFCGSCGDVLLGDAIKVAANLHYHIHCFTCTECGCELVNTGFFTKLGKYYCTEDYHALFGTLCNLCSKYIEGEGLSVQGRGKSYHISCLTCTKCGGRFDEGARITFEKDQTLCDSCKISESKQQGSEHLCASCNLQIVGTTIFAMEQEWHMNCFTCQECKTPLTGEYMCKDRTPYCEEDYQRLYGQSCNICSEFILGKVLQAGGNSYHTSCLKCYICTQQFEEGQEIFMQDELFWHTDCDETTHPAAATEEKVEPVPEKEETAPSEKSAPELILPPPPSASPPASSSTPPAESLEAQILGDLAGNEQLSVDEMRDRAISDVSIKSDYEDLTVPQEMNREIVYDSDFEAEAKEEKPSKSPEPRPSSLTPEQEPTVEPVVESARPISDSTAPKSQSTAPNSVSTPPQSTSTPPGSVSAPPGSVSTPPKSVKSESTAPKSESTPSESSLEIPQTNIESDKSEVDKFEVFTDVSEPVVVNENGKKSVSSEQPEEEEEDEKPLSVKEILRRAQEKEREALGAAVLPPKMANKPASVTKRYLSTESEASDRSSEASDPPAKPPRAKSPVRGSVSKSEGKKFSTSSETTERSISPNSGISVRGLRTVDSPIRLDEDVDNEEIEIDYLDFQETYDLVILQTQKMRLPQGIDKSQLQAYLTPGQFETAFKMSPDMFKALPLWRKTNLKKSLKLF